MEGPESHGFPSAGIDLIHHEVRVNIFQVKNKKEYRLETVTFSGRMVIERGNPYKNKEGVSQVDFIVKSWVASTWSKSLKQQLIYSLSADTEQPMSQIIAGQKNADYPASIQFNVIFDAIANSRIIKPKHHGRPAATKFMSIPPAENGDVKLAPTMTTFGDDDIIDSFVVLRGGKVEFLSANEKLSVKDARVLHLRIKPLDCNDKEGKTVVTFVDLEMPPGLPKEIGGLLTEIPLLKDSRLS